IKGGHMKQTVTSLILVLLMTATAVSPFARTPANEFGIAPRAVPQSSSSDAIQTGDGGWPRGYSLPSEAQIVLHQPQIASWENQKHIVAYAAVSHIAKGEQKPTLGTLKLEADTDVSLSSRLVKFTTLKITEAHFEKLSKEQTSEIASEVEKTIPDEERVIALDRVLAYLDKSQIIPKNVDGLKSDPPTIFLSRKPAILVNFDGEPIWSPIKDNELQFAVNTNWDVFQHSPTGVYYLRNENIWLRAVDLKGPWTPAGKLPDSFSKLPADDNWKDVRENLPGAKPAHVPTVYVSTEPAELISIEGAPKYVPVPGTSLQWISNSESDLFRVGTDGAVYYLVAGRWFRAPNLNGNWVFATPNLPEDFKRISLEHPRSRVLASVPGTDQAA